MALWQLMHLGTLRIQLLAPMNQRVLSKLRSTECNMNGIKRSTTDRLFNSYRRKMVIIYIYAIMKTMYYPGCHHNACVATNALGHMMYSYTLLAPMNQGVLNELRSKKRNVIDFMVTYILHSSYFIEI